MRNELSLASAPRLTLWTLVAACGSLSACSVEMARLPEPGPVSAIPDLVAESELLASVMGIDHAAFMGASGPTIPGIDPYGYSIFGQASHNDDPVLSGASTNLSQISFSTEGADFDPDVARDGSRIVFSSTQHSPTADIYTKAIGSRVVTQLTNDGARDVMPRISPDGTKIAFASDRAGNWDIYVMPITGGRAVQVTSGGTSELHPSWSPSGTEIVFSRFGAVSGQWEMWVTEPGNPGVSNFIGYGLFPEWCPVAGTGENGGDRILFQKSRGRGDHAFGIWTIDYRGGQAGNATEIVSTVRAACITPSWSPDGAWVAFATVPSGGPTGSPEARRPKSGEIWLADLEGRSRIKLTAGNELNLMPTWGPGNRVYFVSSRGGTDNIWSLDAGGAVALASGNAKPTETAAVTTDGAGKD